MLMIDLHGKERRAVTHLVLDVNGTVACDGTLIDGVREAVSALRDHLTVVLVTADTRGSAAGIATSLGVAVEVIGAGDEIARKRAFVEALGASSTVAIGNGANDAGMLEAAALGVCVIGPEGAAATAMAAADVVTTSIVDALGLLGKPSRLIATMRV